MKVLFDNQKINYKYQSFGTNCKRKYDAERGVVYRNNTTFFRNDFPWSIFQYIFEEQFQNAPFVNFYDFACSDGSEPMSFAVFIQEKLSQYKNKISNIYAYDTDDEMINLAKSGYCEASEVALERLNEMSGGDYHKYFNDIELDNYAIYNDAISPKSIISSMIQYKKGNILDLVDKLPAKNNIISCRNMWGYLLQHEKELLLEKLSKKFDGTSLIFIGKFDKDCHIPELLKMYNFSEIHSYIFKKMPKF